MTGKRPRVAPPALAVRAALAARKALLRAADLVVPAQVAVLERVAAAAGGHVLGELARLRVADRIEERPLSAAELADGTGTNADAMGRTMRAAVAFGIFARDADGRFRNNRISSALLSADDGSVRSFAEYFGSRANKEAWCDFPETLRTGRNAFERVHGKSVWEWLDEHPDEREAFSQGMMSMTLLEAPGIAAAYPFDEVVRLCDVGGGRGTLLGEVLVRHRHVHAVLCDSAGVLDAARELLARRGVLDRVELVAGSFFDAVPKGCDAYVMKNILHDWDDARSLSILKNCRAAMEPGNKLLVLESLVEDSIDDLTALSDLQMMVVTSDGRERSKSEFARLFAESGFRLSRVHDTPTPTAVIEALAI